MGRGKAEYEKIIILHRIKKAELFVKELVPFSVRTEDKKLSSLIEDFIEKRYQYSTVKVREEESAEQYHNRQHTLREDAVAARQSLLDYCEEMIANVKPQWQILAEQNGWGPLQQKLF